jgi:hypothetical protein
VLVASRREAVQRAVGGTLVCVHALHRVEDSGSNRVEHVRDECALISMIPMIPEILMILIPLHIDHAL